MTEHRSKGANSTIEYRCRSSYHSRKQSRRACPACMIELSAGGNGSSVDPSSSSWFHQHSSPDAHFEDEGRDEPYSSSRPTYCRASHTTNYRYDKSILCNVIDGLGGVPDRACCRTRRQGSATSQTPISLRHVSPKSGQRSAKVAFSIGSAGSWQ